jgi:sensor domain CHASE-containing protein
MGRIGTLADVVLLWPLCLGIAVAVVIIWLTRHADPFRSGRIRRDVRTHADRTEPNIRQEMNLRIIALHGMAQQDFNDR